MLKKAVELSPDEGHEKYMYLSQLLEGAEALAMVQKGVELLQKELDRATAEAAAAAAAGTAGGAEAAAEDEDMEDDEEDEEEEGDQVEELKNAVCSALCAHAEMLMGHAETVESVAEEAEALLRRAQATCSTNPEPGQAMASLRYEQGKPEEALALLKDSMKLWFKPREEDEEDEEMEDEEVEEGKKAGKKGKKGRREAVGEEEEEDDDEEGGPDGLFDEDLPSYEFRFECAKLLLELDDSTAAAIQVLEDMVEEDDSNPHTWHLLGMAYYAGLMLEEAQVRGGPGLLC